MKRMRILAAMGVLAACRPDSGSDAPVADAAGEEWIETGPLGPPGPRPADNGGVGDEDDEGDGEDDEDDEDDGDSFLGWFGEGQVVPGTSYDARGEVVDVSGGVDRCLLVWSASSAPTEACAECEWAFVLTIDTVEVESDEDCSRLEVDPKRLVGSTLGIGRSGERLFVDFGEGFEWAEEGFAEVEDDEFFWDLPLE